jgi:hypothetical protein
VVVALHLEGERPPVTHLDYASIFTRSLQYSWSSVRESSEKRTGVLVTAVLAPHHREEGELQVVRRPAKELEDAVVLVFGES